jgi:IS30 family transposase
MLKQGFSKADIAKALGKCERSIYYEINRGLCTQQTTEYEFIEVYSPEQAERKYREFLAAKGPELKIGKDFDLVRRLEELIVERGYSPGAALAEIRNNGEQYTTEICENTVYNYIYRGDVFLVLTKDFLYEKGRRHYATRSKQKAARAPRGESIENRPKEIKSREKFGHWEMDSIVGCKGSRKTLLVLTERRTRMGIVMLLEDHTAASVVKAINHLERRFGRLFYVLFKSITVDNGCEFQDFEGIEIAHRRKGKRTVVFFCHPYSAYERGSNENMNRLIRRFFPKGTNFDDVTKEQVAEAERWVNSYPRKILGWKSSKELFDRELRAA